MKEISHDLDFLKILLCEQYQENKKLTTNRKIFAKYTSAKGLLFNIYKELLTLRDKKKKPNNLIKDAV